MTRKPPNLSDAYALHSPEDSRKLYADWAADYDQTFATAEDYQLHFHTAQAFRAAHGRGPVLDVGAGTGLCGAVLADMGIGPIDATDISDEMLGRAEAKDIYRDLIAANLLDGLPVAPGTYAGIVSSGTFTTGHIGPEGFAPLLPVARRGAVFAVSINARHYESAGFERAFQTLMGRIRDLHLNEVSIYGQKATGAHKDDTALIATFRKA
jgi:SAM-dependent methyltransferase